MLRADPVQACGKGWLAEQPRRGTTNGAYGACKANRREAAQSSSRMQQALAGRADGRRAWGENK